MYETDSMYPKRSILYFTELLMIGIVLPLGFVVLLLDTGWLSDTNDVFHIIPLPLLIVLFYAAFSVWKDYWICSRKLTFKSYTFSAEEIGKIISENHDLIMEVHNEVVICRDKRRISHYVLKIEKVNHEIILQSAIAGPLGKLEHVSAFSYHQQMNESIYPELHFLFQHPTHFSIRKRKFLIPEHSLLSAH